MRPVTYWSARRVMEAGAADPFRGGAEEAIDRLDSLLYSAVSCRMIADVPLGAFLSGGIDSSLVVSMMQEASTLPVKTFTIGFHDDVFNEAHFAKTVAEYLGTDHTELYVTPRETLDLVPRIPSLFDEPFADSSQIPTFMVSRLARRHVTVALSGDGGDELFAGYNRYFKGAHLWSRTSCYPYPLRRSLAGLMEKIPLTAWSKLVRALRFTLPSEFSSRPLGDSITKIIDVLQSRDTRELYSRFSSNWKEPERLALGSKEPPTLLTGVYNESRLSDFVRLMMLADLTGYHADDILVKVDRASMGVSLEARVPIIDHRVVEFSARLPLSMMAREGQGKWILRQILYRRDTSDVARPAQKGIWSTDRPMVARFLAVLGRRFTGPGFSPSSRLFKSRSGS